MSESTDCTLLAVACRNERERTPFLVAPQWVLWLCWTHTTTLVAVSLSLNIHENVEPERRKKKAFAPVCTGACTFV